MFDFYFFLSSEFRGENDAFKDSESGKEDEVKSDIQSFRQLACNS